MTHLLKIMALIASFFACTFIIIKGFNLLTIEDIQSWLNSAKTVSPLWVGLIVILLLFADLFIAVPTLTVVLLAGYFLGASLGSLAAFTGLLLSGLSGYGLSALLGTPLFEKIMRDETKRQEATAAFKDHGFVMILLSRAIPILPEITACLAGLTSMKPHRFLLAWCISSLPYVTIAAYAGSISTLTDPKPAIYAAISLTSILWFGWYLLRLKIKMQSKHNL